MTYFDCLDHIRARAIKDLMGFAAFCLEAPQLWHSFEKDETIIIYPEGNRVITEVYYKNNWSSSRYNMHMSEMIDMLNEWNAEFLGHI